MLSENKFQNILVTGSSGLVGSHVADLLLQQGYKVYLQYFSNKPINDHPNASIVKMNLQQPVTDFDEVDFVVHCAAEIPASFSDEHVYEVAVKNTVIDNHVINFCKTKNTKLIYFSSVNIYGSAAMPWSENTAALPDNPYSKAKYDTEKKIRESLNDYLIYRISSPYGPGQKNKNVLLKFLESKFKNQNIFLFNKGSRKQDFVNVKDIALAVLKGIEMPEATGIFNIAAGKTTSMYKLAELILNTPPKTHTQIVYSDENDLQKYFNPIINIHKSKEILGWEPETSIVEGLNLMTAADYK